MSVISVLADYFSKTFRLFFLPDTDLDSEKYRDILDNPKDKENYLNAIKDAKENSKEQRITLSSGEVLVVAP